MHAHYYSIYREENCRPTNRTHRTKYATINKKPKNHSTFIEKSAQLPERDPSTVRASVKVSLKLCKERARCARIIALSRSDACRIKNRMRKNDSDSKQTATKLSYIGVSMCGIARAGEHDPMQQHKSKE